MMPNFNFLQKNKIFLLFSLVLLLTGCPAPPDTEKKGTLELNFQLKINGGDGGLRETYQISDKQYLYLDSLRFYVSDVKAIKSDGSEVQLADVLLFDFNKGTLRTTHGTGIFYQFEATVGSYKGMKFKLGLPSALNHGDPDSYGMDHPLNRARGTFWNIQDGYYFLQIAGKSDSLMNGSYAQTVSYQIGTDALLQTKDYSSSQTHKFDIKSETETQFIIQIELTEILKDINLLTQPYTHSRPAGSAEALLAKQMMEQFALKSLYKVP